MMETVLYDDYNSMHNNFLTSAAGMNNQLKRKLTLDLDFGSGGDGSGLNAKQMSVIKKAKVASLNTPSSLAILSSPDLYKLNLASPELEKLVIQQALTLPTPNPTQSQIFFPKNVTEEQEAYVQGFTEALSKLHDQNPGANNNNNNSINIIGGVSSNSIIINTSTSIQPLTTTAAGQLTQEQQQQLQILQLNNNVQRLVEVGHQQPPPPAYYDHDTSSGSEEESMSENSCSNSTSSSITYSNSGHLGLPTTIPSMLNSAHAAFPVVVTSANNNNNSMMHHRLPDYGNPMGTNGGATGSSGNIAAIPISTAGYNNSSSSPQTVVLIKEEPQTVPNVSSPAPVSPIDMESQERIKLERKRQRNRLAASKCRKRKLERISKLEDKVKLLKGENADLSSVLTKLKDTVCTLKQQVMDHVNSGCHIIISPNLSSTF